MKKLLITLAVISPLTTMAKSTNVNPSTTEIMNEKEISAIKKTLFSYRDALNESSVDKVMPLYTTNGVFMPSGAPTAIGQEQVKGAYQFVFSNIQLNIEFYIDEIEVIGDYAFARTTSKGTTLIHATGETVPEENRELFMLKKENGTWKIDRYMFNKSK
jgi:ketosteroid isomerase-like protein